MRAHPKSILRTSARLARPASSPKAVLRMRRISRGNSRSGVSTEYHVSYTNCSQNKSHTPQVPEQHPETDWPASCGRMKLCTGAESSLNDFMMPGILHGYNAGAAIDWQACMRFADSFATSIMYSFLRSVGEALWHLLNDAAAQGLPRMLHDWRGNLLPPLVV